MATNPMRLTADDVSDIPVPAHIRGYELVDGQLVPVIVTSPPHGRVQSRLAYLLISHIEAHGIRGVVYSDTSYVLRLRSDQERVREPDLSYVSAETLRTHGGEPTRGYFRLVADIVVEIDSPGREPMIERQRVQDYTEAGVKLYWVIHTRTRSVTVYSASGSARLGPNDVLDGGAVLPGLQIPLARLFETIDDA